MSHRHDRALSVNALARVEGEGGLHVRVEGDRVVDARLRIYEPPRFFEALLRGRPFTDAPDVTARICGICPVAYQLSSSHAMGPAHPISMRSGIGTCATAAPAAVTRRMLASAGASFVVAIVWIGT